ncbi:TolC family protein [Pedobacter sp. HMF7056]|uniref:TolC family protein n=2 Tax=Hufsiella ginkgonis TaxID=2695274 RepID=A0A7K1XVN5_9SPHI|nr:TolC family protein [Hufsiella ginkgonis]
MALICSPFAGFAQGAGTLSLDEAYHLAEHNYPMIRQRDLVKQTADLTIQNLSRAFLPQVTLNGQATYQSAVTSVPISLPGFSISTPDKDQYKATADVTQLLFDGGVTGSQKALQQLNAEVESEKVTVELYKVKDRINQLYLGVLLLDAQLEQVQLVEDDIQTGLKKTEALVNNGVTFRSNLDVLKAQFLQTGQRRIELRASRKGLINALSLFTGRQLDERIVLQQPAAATAISAAVTRPELTLYNKQSALLEQQKKTLLARNLPKASLFGQGGYGKPGLNMLDNNFDWFYLAGVRLNWSLGGWYTYKKERKLVDISKRSICVQQETFLLNTNSQLIQQRSEIDKLQQLVTSDRDIIALREKVKLAARAQLENQVITANDYLREVNAEDQARQALILHQLQLVQAQINYKTIAGN